MSREMINIGENIKKLRASRKLTLEALANDLNSIYSDRFNFNKGKLSKWENNKEEPMLSSIKLLADYYNVTIEDIYKGRTNSNISVLYEKLDPPRQIKVYDFASRQLSEQNNKVVPLVGATAANPQALEYADTINDISINTDVPNSADCALVVRGNSMEPDYMNSSIVFYKRQEMVENGELAIVEIDGDGVTFKKVIFDYENQQLILRSLNPEYPDRILKDNEYRIIGKVVK